MPKLNFDGIINGVNKVVGALAEIAPLAVKLGLPPVVANVATIAISATGVIQNILERSANLKDALTTQEEEKLRAMLADLQAINDQLAGTIADDAAEAAKETPNA